MENNRKISGITLIILLMVVLFSASCTSSRKIKIFADLKNDSSSLIINSKIDNTIKPGDILQITVFCLDEVTKGLLNNMPSGNSTSGGGTIGYLVDDSGYIKFPLLGSVSTKGLIKEKLEEQIRQDLIKNKFVIDPIVTVRIANFKITVLGEVNRPGVLNIPNERINIIEAIGLAGDLNVFAKRDNILLIRETNGKRIYKRFSLNDKDLFNKDYFYLQNQDVIYVEPAKAKAAALDRSTSIISLGLSTLNILILVYSQLLVR